MIYRRPSRSERRRAQRRKRFTLRRMRRRVRSRALEALCTAAMCLPGLSGSAGAGSPVEQTQIDYRFSYYKESNLPPHLLAAGSRDRFEIDVHQMRAVTPIGSRMDVAVDFAYESMSGASPWFVVPDPSGGEQPLQVMSGATIEDQRTDALVKGSYYFDEARAGLAAGVSIENDYRSISGGLDTDLDFNEGRTTLSLGGGFSIDKIEPTDAKLHPTRPDEADKASGSVFAGISQIINQNATLQSTLSYKYSNGYLSDPYKMVYVGGITEADLRPDQRHQGSILTRYRHHISPLHGTLHADYRFYLDDWKVSSHTVELAWYQSLWDAARLIPSFRYYSQSQAEFYAPYFESSPADGLQSSDYRLSPYGALSWGLAAEGGFEIGGRVRFDTTLSWRQYLSSASYALGKVAVANPGLVSYHVFSIGLRAKF